MFIRTLITPSILVVSQSNTQNTPPHFLINNNNNNNNNNNKKDFVILKEGGTYPKRLNFLYGTRKEKRGKKKIISKKNQSH